MGQLSQSVTEAVLFLDEANQEELENLRKKYPHLEKDLVPGGTLGRSEAQIKDEANIVSTALENLVKILDKALYAAKAQAQRARKIRFWMQVIAAASSAAAGVQIAGDWSMWGALIAAIVAFLTSLLGIWAKDVETPLFGQRTIYELIPEIINVKFRAQSAADRLRLLVRHNLDDPQISELIGAHADIQKESEIILAKVNADVKKLVRMTS